MSRRVRRRQQISTEWRPTNSTTLAPWQHYSAECIQHRASIFEEARRLATKVHGLVDLAPERAEQLALHCVELGEQELLLEALKRARMANSYRAWTKLLSELMLTRRAGPARR